MHAHCIQFPPRAVFRMQFSCEHPTENNWNNPSSAQKIHDATLTKWQPMRHFNSFIYASNTCYKFMRFFPSDFSVRLLHRFHLLLQKKTSIFFSMQHKTESISIFFYIILYQSFFLYTKLDIWMQMNGRKKNQRRWIKAIFHFCSSFPLLIGIQTFILIPMHSSACKLFQWN